MEAVRDRVRMGSSNDKAESALRAIDEKATNATGISLFHVLTAAAILGSIYLFVTGRRSEAIFVGLWPPTFQALKSAAEKK